MKYEEKGNGGWDPLRLGKRRELGLGIRKKPSSGSGEMIEKIWGRGQRSLKERGFGTNLKRKKKRWSGGNLAKKDSGPGGSSAKDRTAMHRRKDD